jgi:hypothetical protein
MHAGGPSGGVGLSPRLASQAYAHIYFIEAPALPCDLQTTGAL